MSTAERLSGREHIPRYPRGWIVLRILQLVFALLLIGLCVYSLSLDVWAGTCVMLFTAVITIAISIWLTCAHSCTPHAFNYWAALAFDFFLYVFWLMSFIMMAVGAAERFSMNTMGHASGSDDYWNDYYSRHHHGHKAIVEASILAAAAGLGAIQFFFFFISWVIDAIVIYRHRKAGLHCEPLKEDPVSLKMAPQIETEYKPAPQFNQNTAYTPQPLSHDQRQHGLAPAAAPLAPQPAAVSFHNTVSPAPSQSPKQAPYTNQASYDPHQQHH
ncbi:hypothetical protein PT974_06152 [Cladobotryum mycophilum]|uniref:MARVEL domain-containing protein n=1 Tax=Cladobotryum mycophilum TaxID=491253 RepID=A0ABR0SLZ7_9HYPO